MPLTSEEFFMAGLIPSFASGSLLAIQIGKLNLAYGTNLSFTDDINTMAVGGIGSYSYDALEPTGYIARGNFSLMRYSALARTGIDAAGGLMPGRAGSDNELVDGNSMYHPSAFNPVKLLISKTFDIHIYERTADEVAGSTGKYQAGGLGGLIFTLKNCRLTNYSIGFTPGSLVAENIGFMCILVQDEVAKG
jgi:hypothetical protein